MKFDTIGNKDNPVIVMLSGSFCPGECMEYIYEKLCDTFYVIVPTYNGHYEGSKDFTTRENEANEIKKYFIDNNISSVKMIYGQSMGAEIGIELIRQLNEEGIRIDSAFFDGGPFIKLSKAYKTFMYIKFKTMISLLKHKSVDDVVNWKFLKKFTNGDTESLRNMIESLVVTSDFLTAKSIKSENECCYTFDFPSMNFDMQKKMYFFYAKEEKAYKMCYKYAKKAYPNANYRVVSGYGHLTYSVKNTDEYVKWIKEICS